MWSRRLPTAERRWPRSSAPRPTWSCSTWRCRGWTARRGDRDLALSPREADLLELLLRNRGQVVTRELAVERVWGGPGAVGWNSVDRYVSYLRTKLGKPGLIDTVRGVGFVLR